MKVKASELQAAEACLKNILSAQSKARESAWLKHVTDELAKALQSEKDPCELPVLIKTQQFLGTQAKFEPADLQALRFLLRDPLPLPKPVVLKKKEGAE